MTFLGIWLLAVGLADVVRWRDAATSVRSSVAIVSGTATTASLLALGGVGPWSVVAASLGTAGSLALWVVVSSRALQDGLPAGWAIGVMAGEVLALLGLSAVTPSASGGPLGDWYDGLQVASLSGVAFERFLLGLGALVYLQVTANVLIRLILLGAGTPAAEGETTLRGGRLLGPMERTFIFGLGLTGELTAASVIVAAKGIVRFPEIRAVRDTEPRGADSVTEYFLIGTLASWLLALALLALV